jgi:hypothetical protein
MKKEYVRDGNRKIIASITSDYDDETQIVRDANNHIAGKVHHRFKNTRDAHGNFVSVDTADPGLLIEKNDRR